MRLSMAMMIGAAAMAAVWARAALPPAEAPTGPTQAAPDAAAGIEAALAARGAAPLPGLAVEIGADGVARVRGRAPAAAGPTRGWPAPLYAEARPLCDAGAARGDCWRVTRLELDGRPAELDE